METLLQMRRVLLWKFCHHQQKSMIEQRKCNYIVSRRVEIYELDYEGEIPKYYLLKTITEENKDELHLIHFPQIKITFDELFEEID